MRTTIRSFATAGLLSLALFACDDVGTGPDAVSDATIRAEAALIAADGMFQDLSLAQDPGLQAFGFNGMAGGPSPAGPMGGNQCQGSGAQGTFSCPAMARGGFTFTREVTFLDATGEVQPDGFEATTTDGIHLISIASGSVERTFWTATMDRARDMLITGLLSDSHTLNGTGSGNVYRSGNPQEGLARTFKMATTATWTEVIHVQPREENPYPASGTVERQISVTVTKDGETIRSLDVTTLITFNGTQFVTMIVDGEEFEIDLANREVKGRFGNGGKNG